MFKPQASFSSFSVNDLVEAKEFYTKILHLKITDETMGMQFALPGGGGLFIYPKEDHEPAMFTVLNFIVEDIDSAVDGLIKLGVKFEKYEGFHQDEKGIARSKAANMGPDIAWFKDPSGNILSVIQDK